MTGFFSLVPFEDRIYLIKATESQPLVGEELERIDSLLKEGKAISDIQEELADVWNS